MDQTTHVIRAQYWKDIIHKCNQRPTNQSAKSWMDEHDISEQRYYYWQRRFRKEVFSHLQTQESTALVATDDDKDTGISFVEISRSPSETTATQRTSGTKPVAILRNASMIVEITNDISDHILTHILKVVSNA